MGDGVLTTSVAARGGGGTGVCTTTGVAASAGVLPRTLVAGTAGAGLAFGGTAGGAGFAFAGTAGGAGFAFGGTAGVAAFAGDATAAVRALLAEGVSSSWSLEVRFTDPTKDLTLANISLRAPMFGAGGGCTTAFGRTM